MHYVSTPPANSLDAKAVAATARTAGSTIAIYGAAAGTLSCRELRQIVADLVG